MKRIFGRERPPSIITPFPIEIDPEPLIAHEAQDTSYALRASEKADIVRKVLPLYPDSGSWDEKQREITGAAVLSILRALDSCRTLGLPANREKTNHQSGRGHQGDKKVCSAAAAVVEKSNGKEGIKAKGKEKDGENLLADLVGAKESLARTGYAASTLAKPRRVPECFGKTQLQTRQKEQQNFLNFEAQEPLHVGVKNFRWQMVFDNSSPTTLTQNLSQKPSPSSDERSMSAKDIMHHLFQEYKIGKDNTQLLSDALLFATVEQLEIEITRSFYKKCQAIQALLHAQIPWASAVADHARLVQDFRHKEKAVSEVTPQEMLVAALVQSNQALSEALRIYADLESAAVKNGAEKNSLKQCQNGLSNEECCSTSSVLDLADSLSRIPTPPPSYEGPPDAPAVIQSLPLPSKDTTDKVTIHTKGLVSSSDSSNECGKLTPPHSSRFNPVASPQVLEESRGLLSTSQVYGPSETTESTASPFKPSSSCSQSSPLAISIPGSATQGIASTSSENQITPPETPVLFKSVVHATETSQKALGSITSTVQDEISPVHKEVIVRVPDLTGRITREGDYPAGRGGFADVWKCVLRSKADECSVAVKVLQSHIHDPDLEGKFARRIRREILVWQRLNHENVLPLLGTVSHFGRYMSLVSPWMDNGSLMQYLQECGDDMSIVRRLQLACDVAAGLTYLHSSRVVHGDLTGTNILIGDEGKACLCDFGLSSLMLEFHDTTFCTSTIGGNARWAAPEIYRIPVDDVVSSATTQSDVYSLGCIMLEILSGRVPYHYLPREGQVLLELQNGNKPRRPDEGHVSDVLWNKINECWADNPVDRPTADYVAQFLTRQFTLKKSARLH